MMMKKLFLLAFMALFFVSCQNTAQKSLKIGDEIVLQSVFDANITLVRTQNGFKLKNSDKIIMFDIFGTFCEPCRAEAGNLMDYQIKNSEDLQIIALTHFENISDKDIVQNFAKKYNAYYFISNSKQNSLIIETILRDINYKDDLQIPFKVVLKNGAYQQITDNLNINKSGQKFYLGYVKTSLMQLDLDRIKNATN